MELCNSGGDSTLQYYNPFVEWNPHAPSVVWAMHKFFPENYMGPIGLSVEEENMRAAPGTPQGGALYARIVPRSNMLEAIRGETFVLTLSKGYLTEIKDEAKAIGRGALIPRELECFEQARKVMRLIRSGKVVPPTVELPRGGYSHVAVDAVQLERQWDAWAAAMLADVMLSIYPSIVLHEMSRYQDKMVILLRCLAASGTGAALRIAAALGRVRSAGVQGGIRGPGCDCVLSAGSDVQHCIHEEQERDGPSNVGGGHPQVQDKE